MLRLGAVGAAPDGAGAGRRSGQRQSVPRSLRGRTMAVTATATRLMVMVMGPATVTRLMATAMAPVTATRLIAVTAIRLTAMAPVTAIRLTAMAMAGALSAELSTAPLGVAVGKEPDKASRRVSAERAPSLTLQTQRSRALRGRFERIRFFRRLVFVGQPARSGA